MLWYLLFDHIFYYYYKFTVQSIHTIVIAYTIAFTAVNAAEPDLSSWVSAVCSCGEPSSFACAPRPHWGHASADSKNPLCTSFAQWIVTCAPVAGLRVKPPVRDPRKVPTS